MSSKEIIESIKNSDESAFDEILERDGKKSLDASTLKGLHVGAMRIHDIDASNTEWEACIFDGTDFNDIDLQGAFFNGCSFQGCHFSKAVLAEASFDGCVLNRCGIADAEDLEACELTNCQLRECALSGLHFVDSTLESLTINGGSISDLSGIAELKSVVLRNVDVKEFDTSEMTLTSCTASGCANVPAGFKACEGRRRRV